MGGDWMEQSREVELLQPERRLGAPAAAEAAAHGPREPLQQRGRPAGLRPAGVDVPAAGCGVAFGIRAM